MKNIELLSKRVSELIELAEETKNSYRKKSHGGSLDYELFARLRSSGLSFIEKMYGKEHPYYTDFDKKVKSSSYQSTPKAAKAIFQSIKDELDNGYLFEIKGLVSAEIFSDFLEMANYLIEGGYKDPAAVMIGSTLEEHLRQLCRTNGIDTTFENSKGNIKPKKANRLNADLGNEEVYNKLDQKNVTSWFDLRNKAAHGHYEKYTHEQVEIMYRSVTDFMARNPI